MPPLAQKKRENPAYTAMDRSKQALDPKLCQISGDWGPCDSSCGEGLQTRRVECCLAGFSV